MSRTKGSNIRRQEEYFSHIELGITPTLLHRTPDGLFKNSDEFHQLRKSVVSILYKEDGEQVQDVDKCGNPGGYKYHEATDPDLGGIFREPFVANIPRPFP